MKKPIVKILAGSIVLLSLLPSMGQANDTNAVDPNQFLIDHKIDQEMSPITEESIRESEAETEKYRPLHEMYGKLFKGEVSLDEMIAFEQDFYRRVDPSVLENKEAVLASGPIVKEALKQFNAEREFALLDPSRNEIMVPYAIGDKQSKYLPMPYEYQSTQYNCGPATAVNIINGYRGYNYMTQAKAAQLLQTTSNGTNFGDNWKNVLNKTTMNKTYSLTHGYSGWASKLADKAISTIINGRGVALNTYMTPNTGYLTGYYSGTVGHYVAGYGFDSTNPSRRYISYLDPNGFNSEAKGAHRVTFQKMAAVTQHRGIIS